MDHRARAVLVGVGTAAVLGGAVYVGYRFFVDRAKHYGRIICPAELGKEAQDTEDVVAGNAIIVAVAAPDGTAMEMTWAMVLEPKRTKLRVQLAGEYTEAGLRQLDTARHGFRLGDVLTIDRDCVHDVYRQSMFQGQILCGPQLAVLDDVVEPNFRPDPGGYAVGRGSRVQVVVASKQAQGTAWYEPLWIEITSISPTGQVLTGTIESDPKLTEHGLARKDALSFNRDCIVAIA